MGWPVVEDILNEAAGELGLIAADIADPFGSRDANILQLIRHLNACGRDLARDYSWTQLQRRHVFSTVAAQETYDLPADFLRLTDQTAWNQSSQLPLAGPLGPQAWSLLKAVGLGGPLELYSRFSGRTVSFQPVPTVVETIAFEYLTENWVAVPPALTTSLTKASAVGQQAWFDPRLLVCGTKLYFLRAKGFDSTAAQNDFDVRLSAARGGDGAAPVLSLSGRAARDRLLDARNAPATGFGGSGGLDGGGLY